MFQAAPFFWLCSPCCPLEPVRAIKQSQAGPLEDDNIAVGYLLPRVNEVVAVCDCIAKSAMSSEVPSISGCDAAR